MDEAAQHTAVAILEKYLTDDQYNVHVLDDAVSVQLHLLPEEFGALTRTLTEAGYSFEVSSGFEMPPKITIQSRYWPDEVESVEV